MRARRNYPSGPATVVAGSLVVLTLLGGCGGDAEAADSPDGAWEELSSVSSSLLTGAAPGAEVTPEASDPVPCGGYLGTDSTRVHVPYEATVEPREEPREVIRRVVAALKAGGVEPADPERRGKSRVVSFGNELFAGEAVLSPNGRLTVRASTACLENPDAT